MRKNLHHKIMLSILAGSLALGFVYAPPAFAEDVLIADTSYTAPDETQGTYKLDAEGTTAGINYGDEDGYTSITLPTDDIGTFTVTAGNGGETTAKDFDVNFDGANGGSIYLSDIGNVINNGISITAGTGGFSDGGNATGGAGGDVELTFNNVVNGEIKADAGNGGATFIFFWNDCTGGAGSLTYGVFAEHGDGSYDTYANINDTSLHGEGDTDYTGGGILARMDFNGSANGHGYLEASGRVGNADTDYTNSGLRDAYGRAASYSTDGTYYGAHIGAGYVQKLDEKSSIDWYGKLLWARLEGGSANLSTGEHLTFDDADSLRLRIGGRWNYAASDFVSYYAGLGYEYEFDGEASGFTNGLALGDEDLTGGSGVAELGISFKPSKNSPFSLELNLTGFTGEREGFRGGVEAVYTF